MMALCRVVATVSAALSVFVSCTMSLWVFGCDGTFVTVNDPSGL